MRGIDDPKWGLGEGAGMFLCECQGLNIFRNDVDNKASGMHCGTAYACFDKSREKIAWIFGLQMF